jgi:hypothetical protein
MARLGVPAGGRVRKLRAVEDQSAPIPREKRASLEGSIVFGCARSMRTVKGSLGHSLSEQGKRVGRTRRDKPRRSGASRSMPHTSLYSVEPRPVVFRPVKTF